MWSHNAAKKAVFQTIGIQLQATEPILVAFFKVQIALKSRNLVPNFVRERIDISTPFSVLEGTCRRWCRHGQFSCRCWLTWCGSWSRLDWGGSRSGYMFVVEYVEVDELPRERYHFPLSSQVTLQQWHPSTPFTGWDRSNRMTDFQLTVEQCHVE